MMVEGVCRRTLAGSSGTYNIRATELAVDLGRLKSINATVVFLDDTQHCFKLEVCILFNKKKSSLVYS